MHFYSLIYIIGNLLTLLGICLLFAEWKKGTKNYNLGFIFLIIGAGIDLITGLSSFVYNLVSAFHW